MTDSRSCEHEGTKVETASNRLNGVADPEGATILGSCSYAHRHHAYANSGLLIEHDLVIAILLSNLLSLFQTSLTSKSKHSLNCSNRFALQSVFSQDDQQFRFTQWLTRQLLS